MVLGSLIGLGLGMAGGISVRSFRAIGLMLASCSASSWEANWPAAGLCASVF